MEGQNEEHAHAGEEQPRDDEATGEALHLQEAQIDEGVVAVAGAPLLPAKVWNCGSG